MLIRWEPTEAFKGSVHIVLQSSVTYSKLKHTNTHRERGRERERWRQRHFPFQLLHLEGVLPPLCDCLFFFCVCFGIVLLQKSSFWHTIVPHGNIMPCDCFKSGSLQLPSIIDLLCYCCCREFLLWADLQRLAITRKGIVFWSDGQPLSACSVTLSPFKLPHLYHTDGGKIVSHFAHKKYLKEMKLLFILTKTTLFVICSLVALPFPYFQNIRV